MAYERANASAAKELLTKHLILLDCQLSIAQFLISPTKNTKQPQNTRLPPSGKFS